MEKASNDISSEARCDRATTQAKWTFMVYMAGDNNLDGAALRDIEEMARAGSTKEVYILVQLDRIEDNLTRRFRITQGGGFKTDCLESFGDTNTGDPQILYDFVKWAADNHPADRYALILWNHGSGWWEDARSRAAGPAAKKPRRQLFRHAFPQEHRSICYDDNYIDLACFAKSLRKKADAELQAKADNLIAALKPGKGRAILSQGKIGREVRGTCGLSIYFPGDRINSASCVHPLCITGIEITFENGPRLRLVKWGQATDGNALTIQRTVLEET